VSDSNQLEAWVAALARELDLDLTNVDVAALLDVARDAAHGVTRPAAPLATYLVGYATGLRNSDPAAFDHATAVTSELARRWVEEMPG